MTTLKDVEATSKGFRKDKLAAQRDLLIKTLFLCTLTQYSATGQNDRVPGLLRLGLVPLLGELSDKQSQRDALSGSFALVTLARIASLILPASGFSQSLSIGASVVGLDAVAVIAKAILSDLSDSTNEHAQLCADLAIAATSGVVLQPIFHGLMLHLTGSQTVPTLVSLFAAAGCTIGSFLEANSATEAESGGVLPVGPFTIFRLAGSSPYASTALVSSFLSHLAGSLVLSSVLEQITLAASPNASAYLRFLIMSSLAACAGQKVGQYIIANAGLQENSSIAGISVSLASVCCFLNRPRLGALCLLLAQRHSDETDEYLVANRRDGRGAGETWASLAILRSISVFIGMTAFSSLRSRAGEGTVPVVTVTVAFLAEYLRKELRQKAFAIIE